MLKKQLFILFFVPCIVQLRADEVSLELGIFQEIVYKYSPVNCSHSCWHMYDLGLCEIRPYTADAFCDGQLMACEKLGKAIHILAMGGGPRKILRVMTMKNGDINRYESQGFYDRQYDYYSYGRGLTADPEMYTDHHCHCRCFKDYFKIYLGQLRSCEKDNYVIVGIRFNLHDDVLYLQIAQGILGANGVISEFTWVPPPYNPSHYHSVDLDSRTFFLDKLKLGPGYVVTGVKFEFVKATNPIMIEGFAISISGVPFNNATGKLDLKPKNRRIVRAKASTVRKELQYKLRKPHEMSFTVNRPSPAEYNYVKLQQSELETDFGQNTLPLFDSESVIMSPPAPLAGIEIYHNGTEEHAGYISLQLYPRN